MSSRPKIEWEDPEEIALSAEFHGDGLVGQAFAFMCAKGCDAEFLESRLVGLRIYRGRPLKHLSPQLRKKLNRVILKLRDCADDLKEIVPIMFLAGQRGWGIGPLDVPATLMHLANKFEEAANDPLVAKFKNPSIGIRVADLMRDVVEQAGRPHYKHMADLIGAALNRPSFSEGDLKMFVRRSQPATKK